MAPKRKRSNPNPSKQTSQAATYRGVTRHVRTGRFESHIWAEGKQLFLGSFSTQERAALAFDLASVKMRGGRRKPPPQTNFPFELYREEFKAKSWHLGVFTDEAAAAMAYDRAAIARLGCHAPTNFDLSCYRGELGEAAYAQALTLGLLGTKPMAPDSSAIEGPLQGPFDAALDNVMPSLSPLLGGVGDESPSMHSMQAAASAAVWQQLSSETPTSRSA